MANGSGDYVIAFSTHPGNVIDARARGPRSITVLRNAAMTSLFEGVVDATEESVLNALLAARDTTGRQGRAISALDHDAVRSFLSGR